VSSFLHPLSCVFLVLFVSWVDWCTVSFLALSNSQARPIKSIQSPDCSPRYLLFFGAVVPKPRVVAMFVTPSSSLSLCGRCRCYVRCGLYCGVRCVCWCMFGPSSVILIGRDERRTDEKSVEGK
jgi:hypothetical protein